jgi:hypothetical protein
MRRRRVRVDRMRRHGICRELIALGWLIALISAALFAQTPRAGDG